MRINILIVIMVSFIMALLAQQTHETNQQLSELSAQVVHQNKMIDGMALYINNLEREVDAAHHVPTPLSDDEKAEVSILEFDNQINYLTDEQRGSLELARKVGSSEDLSLALMGICMQETLCGVVRSVGHQTAPVGKRSYGIMQVKVSATRDVLKRFPELGTFRTDEEIIAKLLTDDEWNMRIALGYLKILKDRYSLNWKSMLTAYNLGPGGALSLSNPEEYKYTHKVIGHLSKMNLLGDSNG